MTRLGLDHASLSALAPRLIYVHIVGFGRGGAYAGRQAFDDLVQAASGIADLLPKTDRTDAPRFMPTVVADKSTGLHAVYGLLAALWQRQRTGRGQLVEVPMLEVTTSFALVEHLYGHTHKPPRGQWGYTRLLTPNRRPFRTRDGYIAIMPYTDQQWPRFFELAGHAELWTKWRSATRQERNARIDELYATVGTITQERTTGEWMTLLDAHDIPCMRVNQLEDLESDPHLTSVGFFEPHEHPTEGPYVSMRHPVSFSDASTPLRLHPPRLGADAASVLAEIGMEGELDALVDAGALALPAP
jgi:crotonobetainyl-CoA:carnitine CoA-transferase CaiB-like acyl-CoA transferase